jgi:hypothetical protein
MHQKTPLTVLCAFLGFTFACSAPPPKSGDGTNAENSDSNNANNTGTNSAQNSMTTGSLPACGESARPAAPERLLGLSVAPDGTSEGIVTEVTSDTMVIQIGEESTTFGFEGPDLTGLFTAEEAVVVSRELSEDAGSGFETQRVDRVVSPNGAIAEVGRGQASSFGDVAAAPLELPETGASATLGATSSASSCVAESMCGPQTRTSATYEVDLRVGDATETVAVGESVQMDGFTFTVYRANSSSYELVEADECVEEGGSDSTLVVTGAGALDVN